MVPMDRETRFQTALHEIDQALEEGRIDEPAAEALRVGALVEYDQAGYSWGKLLVGIGVILALLVVVLLVVRAFVG